MTTEKLPTPFKASFTGIVNVVRQLGRVRVKPNNREQRETTWTAQE